MDELTIESHGSAGARSNAKRCGESIEPATSHPALPVQESSTGFTIAAVAALAVAGALLWAAIRGPAISPAEVESSAAPCSEARNTDERANGVDEHQLGSAVPPQFAQGTLRSRDCNN